MSSLSSLWRRDLAALLRLTGPVAAARLGVMAMGLTDALVVGRYSAEQLGYQALGWTLPAVAMVAAMGFLSGVQVMTARYLGQGRPELIGGVFKRGLAYALGIGVVAGAALMLLGPLLLHAFRLAPGLADGAAAPLRVFAASLPAILAAACAGLFLEASGRAGVSMAVRFSTTAQPATVRASMAPTTRFMPEKAAASTNWETPAP